MSTSVGVHNLRSTKLVLRVVHLATKKLVQSTVTSEKHRSLLHLNNTLTKTDKVGTNSNTTSGDITQGEDFIVSLGSFSCNLTTALKILYTNTLSCSNNILDGPSLRTLLHIDRTFGKRLVNFISEVEIFKSLGWTSFINEFDFELGFEIVDETNSGSGVTCDVDTGELVLTSILRRLEEDLVLSNSERSTLDGDIVRNEDNLTALWVFRSLHLGHPSNHTNLVSSDFTLATDKFSILSFNQFLSFEQVGWNRLS
mmetsp:Transcript_18928/g.28564  ORF Transcript_18928/g.28564 Transcript_18928/m.28564 type:complete len:255 (+) Transcript_18928:2928-3692(+)